MNEFIHSSWGSWVWGGWCVHVWESSIETGILVVASDVRSSGGMELTSDVWRQPLERPDVSPFFSFFLRESIFFTSADRKSLHDLEKVLSHHIVIFHMTECFVHDEASTVHRFVKHIPPWHEQGMQVTTRRFRETVNRLTVELSRPRHKS